MQVFRIAMISLLAAFVAHPAPCADRGVDVELAVGEISPSSSDSSAWGWWNPDKYERWQPDEASDVSLVEARLLLAGERYTIVLAGEWNPGLEGTGSFVDPASGGTVTERVELESEAYELAIGQVFRVGRRTSIMPWIGPTYMRTSERRTVSADGEPPSDATNDRARASLWGVAAGADLRVQAWSRLDVVARLLMRWAQGTRNADLEILDPGTGQSGSAKLSDSVDQTMWGAELGIRWRFSRVVEVEGGWRTRDWTLDNGPASYSGPYLKAVLCF